MKSFATHVFLVTLGLAFLIQKHEVHAKLTSPVLLISMDGLRASNLDSYMEENPNSNFSKLSSLGVKADYMEPAFPSVTFPNHWTLVTGTRST